MYEYSMCVCHVLSLSLCIYRRGIAENSRKEECEKRKRGRERYRERQRERERV